MPSDLPMTQQSTADFVARENVKHFRAKLQTEADPAMRVHLHLLLLEELQNLESSIERLAILESELGALSECTARQRAVVDADSVCQGHNTPARALLDMLARVVDHYEQYRNILQTGMGPVRHRA